MARNDLADLVFGEKKITFLGSFALNLNNCMGPAMVVLPLINQQAGWVVPLVLLCVVFVLSSFAATMMCEAMQRIPGNRNFDRRFEFSTLVQHYYGDQWYLLAQVFYNLSLQATNVAAMIISAQVTDDFVRKVCGHSFALNYEKWPPRIIGSLNSETMPWGTSTAVVSIGFVVCMIICIPFGFMNLEENIGFQYFSLLGLLLFSAEFCVQFVLNMIPGTAYYVGESDHRPANGPGLTPLIGPEQIHVLGVVTFAFAYVIGIPSWVNEKQPSVSVNKAVWIPASVGLGLKVTVGLLGGWAFCLLDHGQPIRGAEDILTQLAQKSMPLVTRYSTYMWSMTTLLPGIPPFAVMIRYNLVSGRVCSPAWATFWAVIFPWVVTAFCYEKGVLVHLCNWIALLCQGFTNFVAPALLYRRCLEMYPIDSLEETNGSESLLAKKNGVSEQARVDAVPNWIAAFVSRKNFATTIAVFFSGLCFSCIVLNVLNLFLPLGALDT